MYHTSVDCSLSHCIMFIISSAPWKKVQEANIMPVMKKWKLHWWSDSKNSQQNFTSQGYMFSFEGGTSLLRETVTMLRNRDVIYRGPVSFWCMIPVPASLIIAVLKKKKKKKKSLTCRYVRTGLIQTQQHLVRVSFLPISSDQDHMLYHWYWALFAYKYS